MANASEGIDLLRSVLGRDRVWTGTEIPGIYSRDMLVSNRAFATPEEGWAPAAVVRPGSTEDVAAAVRTAGECGLKLVAWGGGTNIMGSAAALQGEVLLDLSAMNRVLEVDADSLCVRVQAGATLQAVEHEAARHGLVLGHDPWTRGQATVGGAISTDGIGYLTPRYGSMGRLVLGLTLVLPDGTVATKRAIERASGFDLARLAVGMEGTLGIVSEATLRLRPRPERQEIISFRFPDFASGFRASSEIWEIGPSLFDFIEPFNEGRRLFPFSDEEAERTLYLGFEGPARIVEAQVLEAVRIASANGGARLAAKVALSYWASRHEIADRVARDRSGRSEADSFLRRLWFDYVHVALPRGRILEYRERALGILAHHGALPTEIALFAHPELLNVYFLRPRTQNDGVERREMSAAFAELIAASHALGGSMEYCHGVGTRLSPFLPEDLGAPALEAYDRIKSALDTRRVLPRLGRRSA
jgi:FAD/FMN-containing dehydrogenase